jgi:hypothetical protein
VEIGVAYIVLEENNSDIFLIAVGVHVCQPVGVAVIATAHIRESNDLSVLGNPIHSGIALGDNCNIYRPIYVLDETGQPVKIVDTVGHNYMNLRLSKGTREDRKEA